MGIQNPPGAGGGGGVTAHSALTGLGVDDHLQYHTDARGDVRYYTQAQLDTALALKAPLASPTFTGTVAGVTKSMVGLASVDNTSDAGKPVSTAQQTALDLKAPLASPTFTGTVAGITKSMVGLGSVDNTSDAGKPVSTAQQTALDLKVDKVTGKALSTEDYTSAEKTKLGGISTGATANDTDANLKARANHTGTQAASTISDFAEAVDDRVNALLVAGTNVTLTYDDTANTMTVASSGGSSFSPSTTFEIYDDWMADSMSGRNGWAQSTSGGSTYTAGGGATNPGLITVDTGATATGRAAVTLGTSLWLFGGGAVTYESLVRIPTLSDGTNTFTCAFGLSDSVTGEAVDGVYFLYDTAGSANWIFKSSNNSVRTTITSTVAVAANTWVKLKFVVDSTGANVEAFINGASIGTNSANIPTGSGRETTIQPLRIIKSLGTTARTAQADYVWITKTFSTAR